MKKKFRVSIICLAVLLAAGMLIAGYYALENRTRVTVSEYFVSSEKIKEEITLVQLSDLHGNEIGKDNALVCRRVRELSPDLILLTGDMFSRDGDGVGETFSLIEGLSGVAPIYYSFGNHEDDYFLENEDNEEEIKWEIEKRGAVILEHRYEDISVKGSEVRLGGFYGYAVDPDPEYFEKLQGDGYFEGWRFDKAWNGGADDGFLKSFSNTDRFTLLMCHIPDTFILFNGFEVYKADLILSGHLHGGQVILPLAGPVIAPHQGLFPKKAFGMFEDGETKVIISKGLGSGKLLPRINNTPEITVIKVEPK